MSISCLGSLIIKTVFGYNSGGQECRCPYSDKQDFLQALGVYELLLIKESVLEDRKIF
jgi:hypothetical protein